MELVVKFEINDIWGEKIKKEMRRSPWPFGIWKYFVVHCLMERTNDGISGGERLFKCMSDEKYVNNWLNTA